MYKDPYSQWVAKAANEREERRKKLRGQGWDERRIEADIQLLKGEQHRWEEEEYDHSLKFMESGGLDYYFVRLMYHLSQTCSEDQLLALIHEGGLISKLKGMLPQGGCSPGNVYYVVLLNMLGSIWTQKAHQLSNELCKRIEDDEARSLQLRQQGNEAFKAGQWTEALSFYWQAAALNPQDHALLNNISLTYLKQGDKNQALNAAEESVKLDPAVAKSWCRLGDAYKAAGRWQLAQLAFSCARELAPGDEDLVARQVEARSHLAVVWDIDSDVPHGMKDMTNGRAFRWMGITKEELNLAVASLEEGDPFDEAFIVAVERHTSESRKIACMQLKQNIMDARALAIATGVMRSSSLPPACPRLQHPSSLPENGESWTISWTDISLRHKQTGLIRHFVTLMSASTHVCKAQVMVLGTPGIKAVRRVLLSGIINPLAGEPSRPMFLLVAHRMFPIFSKVAELCRQWGIHSCVAETAAEAQSSAAHNDTDWGGYNHSDAYVDEDDEHVLCMPGRPDPGNGHIGEPSAPGGSKGGRGSGSRRRGVRVGSCGVKVKGMRY